MERRSKHPFFFHGSMHWYCKDRIVCARLKDLARKVRFRSHLDTLGPKESSLLQ
jgi:hypothetical protein